MSQKWLANIVCVALWGDWLWTVYFTTTKAVAMNQHEGFLFVVMSLILMIFATAGAYHMIGGRDFRGAKQRQI